jgi:hypothetical protein
MIYEINDDAAQSTWAIGSIGVGPDFANAAVRAAVLVKCELRDDFDLLVAL